MGAVYRKPKHVGQKVGRYIYNRHRLHKSGHEPKHKAKHRAKMADMDEQIKNAKGYEQI